MTMTAIPRRTASLAAAVLSAALVLTACADDDGDDVAAPESTPSAQASNTASSESGTRTFVAANGTVKVPADPQRIVTIGNTTAPFLDIGGEPVGVTEESAGVLDPIPADQRARYDAATKVGSEGGEVDLEKLASLKPDLILVQFHSSDWDEIGKQLEAVAPTVYFGLDVEWKTLTDALAEAGNLSDGLAAQKAEFADRLAKMKETYADIIGGTSFVDVSRGSWSDPDTFYIADIGCAEIGRDDLGLDLPEAPAGEDPLAYESLPFEQLSKLSEYDVITYPVDADGQPTEPFESVVATNTWKALPAVESGKALGVFCPGNNSYGPVLKYLESLEKALAKLAAEE